MYAILLLMMSWFWVPDLPKPPPRLGIPKGEVPSNISRCPESCPAPE